MVNTKSLVIISDLHCGSVYGLTPPGWASNNSPHYRLQQEAWIAYTNMVNKWYAPDVLLVNGDCIEGRQDKQGGAELITNDRNVQVDMAVNCIKQWDAGKVLMSYGTAYHASSQAEDFEYNIAKEVGATIEGRLYFELEGMIIDARHKIGTSSIPHGRATPLLREIMWSLIEESLESGPKVNIVIRSHAHYHIWVEQDDRVAFITPALQLSRGRFGSRICTGKTHWGAIRLTLNKGQIVGKDKVLWNLKASKPSVIRIK